MKKTIYETNYERLNNILSGRLDKMDFESLKLESKGFMDLHIDKIGPDRLAISHTYSQNGDRIADPDMELKIHRYDGTNYLEAMTYQDSFGYQEVYPEAKTTGTSPRYCQRAAGT